MRPRVLTRKHYVQWTITPVSVGTSVTQLICEGVPPGDVDLNTEVSEGAIVSAVYIELWVIGQSDTASGNVLATLYKKPGDVANMAHAEQIDLNSYGNKNNVLYHTQGITNDGVANATPFLRQWFKIPKGKQRIGLTHKLNLIIGTQAEAVNFCGFATYKEQL